MQDKGTAVREPQGITQRQRLTLLVVAVAGHALKHMFNAAFFILLPQIKSGLALNNTQVGILSTFRGIAGGLANVPAGFVGDRFAKQRAGILGGSIIMISVFALAIGVATDFWMAAVAAALLSVAISFWHPAAISSLSKEFASRRGFVISLHGTGGSIGETLGPILVGSLLGVISWRLVLQGSVIPGLVFGLMIWAFLRTIPAGSSSESITSGYLQSVFALFRNRRLLLVLLFAAGFSGGQSTVLTFLPIHLKEDLGASSVTIGLYLSLAQVGGIVSQPLMGFASDRLGRKLILAPSMAILGLSFIGLTLAPAGWMFGLVVLVMGAFLFPLMSVLLASAMDLVASGTQAITISLVFGSAFVVSAFAPVAGGVLADSINTEAAFFFAAGLVLAASVLAAVTRWRPQAQGSGRS
ncbi:MAG: MFS transporter [Chloroflexi bacterium]|nr:MFS transporter [Chloroflexota bacterium]